MTNKDKLIFIVLGVAICALGIFIYHQLVFKKKLVTVVVEEEVAVSLPEMPQARMVKPVIESNADYQRPVKINLSHLMRKDLKDWKLEIIDANGRVVRTLRGDGIPPNNIVWDARDDAGAVVDNAYLANYEMTLRRGDYEEQHKDKVVKLVEASLFSPSENYNKDMAVRFDFGLVPLDDVEEWELVVKDFRGEKMRVFAGGGKPPNEIVWKDLDIKRESALRVLEATFELTLRDKSGRFFKYSDSLTSSGAAPGGR